MKKQLLLIAFATAFASSEIKSAAESGTQALLHAPILPDYSLLGLQSPKKWAVTPDQLRDHPNYHAKLALARQIVHQPIEDARAPEQHNPYSTAYKNFTNHLDKGQLRTAQAYLDIIAEIPGLDITDDLMRRNQRQVDRALQERRERQTALAHRIMLDSQFAAVVRTSKEYQDTLAEAQIQTHKAQLTDTFDPTNHNDKLWEKAHEYVQDKQYKKAQALLDLLYASKHDSPEVTHLNRLQRDNNRAFKRQQKEAEREASHGILEKMIDSIGKYLFGGDA